MEVINQEGIIEITSIENQGGTDQSGTLTAKFVRYPGSQQLKVWLPENAWNGYGMYKITEIKKKIIIEEKKVTDIVNGSVQLLFDTIFIPPGEYLLEIENTNGTTHHLYFNKLEENIKLPKEKIVDMPVATKDRPSIHEEIQPEAITNESNDSMWRIYKDGSGNPIPNVDQEIRDNVDSRLAEIFNLKQNNEGPRLEYDDRGRGGYITYVEHDIRIQLWWEFGGGDCHVFIEIPTEKNWESETKTPLSRRREILLFIANTVKRDQGPDWRFEIEDRSISYYG